VTALAVSGETLKKSAFADASPLVNDICDLTQRLSREVVVQRLLLSREPSKHRLCLQLVDIPATLTFLERMFCNHPVAMGKRLVIVKPPSIGECVTDVSLLERVLINMLMNAFEATSVGCEVKTDNRDFGRQSKIFCVECGMYRRVGPRADISTSLFDQKRYRTRAGDIRDSPLRRNTAAW